MLEVMEKYSDKPPYRANLIKQHSVCESNYHKLLRLLPNLQDRDQQELAFSKGDSHGVARFRVIDRAPYTTVIELCLDATWGDWLELPVLQIRLYQDVRMAEVISINKLRHFKAIYTYPNTKMLLPDEKEQLNRLLSEWLNFCLANGHIQENVI